MRARRTATLAFALLSLGSAVASAAPAAPARSSSSALAPVHVRVRAEAGAKRGPSFTAALASLLRGDAITQTIYQQDYDSYLAAKSAEGRLTGTRKTELGAVLGNAQAMAAAGELTPSRLPALLLTLERNRQWWTSEPLPGADEHVSFPPSKIVWEYYPGQGIEIQWLATFGEANGYYLAGHEDANLRQLLDEVIPLATDRAGGIAWEYMFKFDGGAPPWTSGLSQGTALQILARAYARLKEPAYLTAAQQALGIFETPPPQGVRVSTPVGALYAEYTYAPGDRILNGFIQALVGLYEYTSITKDPLGLSLFDAGDAEARAIVPDYDTGAWSLYDQFGESDLNYHELLTEFLQHLCERTSRGQPYTPATPSPAAGPATPAPAGPAASPPSASTGGQSAQAAQASPPSTGGQSAQAAQAGPQIPGDQIYCTTAQRFTEDLHTPPLLSLLSKTLAGGARAGVQFSLSKISTVHMTVREGSRVVWTNAATLERGRPRMLWVTPAGGGTFTVSLSATDLAGNVATTAGTVVVSRQAKTSSTSPAAPRLGA